MSGALDSTQTVVVKSENRGIRGAIGCPALINASHVGVTGSCERLLHMPYLRGKKKDLVAEVAVRAAIFSVGRGKEPSEALSETRMSR